MPGGTSGTWKLFTLAAYVDALGGRLEINAVFDDRVIPLGDVKREKVPA